MEVLKKVFSKKTAGGRVMRTLLQSFIGLTAFFSILLTLPEVHGWLSQQSIVVQFGGMSSVIAIVSAIQNYLEKAWEEIKAWEELERY